MNILVVLLVFCCFVQFSSAQVILQFQGDSSVCNPNGSPCDFDNPDFWYTSLKRDGESIQGNGLVAPAFMTEPFDIVIPGDLASQNFVLHATNVSGYLLRHIKMDKASSTKRNSQENQVAPPQGMQIFFKDTRLFNFQGYTIGDSAASHELIFENTQIDVYSGDVVDWVQLGYSKVHLKGTTVAETGATLHLLEFDTFTLDSAAKIISSAASFMIFGSNGLYNNVASISGTVELVYWTASCTESDVFLNGANITVTGNQYAYFKSRKLIVTGETRVNKIGIEQTPVTIKAAAQVSFGLRDIFNAQVVVNDGSVLTIGNPVDGYINWLDSTELVILGNSKVYFNSPVYMSVAKKRDVAAPYPYVFKVYVGLLEFNQDVTVNANGPTFQTYNVSSQLTFNGKLLDENSYSAFIFTSGSTITFNKGYDLSSNLPSEGVNYLFGNVNMSPNINEVYVEAGGSVTLFNTTLQGLDIVALNSDVNGYGYVMGNVLLNTTTGSSKLFLFPVGEKLIVGVKTTIPASSIIKLQCNSTACAYLLTDDLQVSSDVSFEIDFIGATPTQNTTFLVVKYYFDFTGVLPESPNPQTFEVEHNVGTKEIYVHYIHSNTPTSNPTGEPTNTPNEPSEPQTPSNSPPTNSPNSPNSPNSAVKSMSIPKFLFAMIMVALVMLKNSK